MGLTVSRRLLCSAIGMAVAGQGQAAAIKLDAFVDGKPAAVAEVLLDGESIGGSVSGESFWYDEVGGGRHQLQLRIDGETIPYEFSVSADEAAVITVNRASASGESTKSLQRIDLARFDASEGDAVMIAPGEGDDMAPGLIQGSVVGGDNEAPVRNVTVKVIGGDAQTVTDRYGSFELELPPGVYGLQLDHEEYRSSRLTALRVLPKMNLAVDVRLSVLDRQAEAPGGAAIEEVQVVGRYLESNPIALERISSSVVDSIDFTQITRFDDSMVSSALKRVVGVSLEEGRYAVVRGMKSRYQSTDLNGATLPSTDPARRDLPLDIFPAGIMQGLSLQKSATADVPSSATAGHISMQTRDIPDQGFFKVSYSAARGDMHGDDMLMSSTGGDRDWLGMDDGSRDIPDLLAPTVGTWLNLKQTDDAFGFNEEQIEAMGEALEHNAIETGEAELDTSLSLSGGQSWDIEEQRLGVISALRYSNKWSSNTKTNYRFGLIPGVGVQVTDHDETRDTNNIIDLSGMLNLQWEFNDLHRLGLNNIALRHTTNSAELVSGYVLSAGKSPEELENLSQDMSGVNLRSRQRVDWIEEQLLSHQLWGEHSFDIAANRPWLSHLGSLGIDWQVNSAATEFDRPNSTQYTYSTEDSMTGSLSLVGGATESYSLWEIMEEENSSYRIDFDLPIDDIYGTDLHFRAGIQDLQRDRDGYSYRYYLRSYSNPNDLEYQKYLENPDPREVYHPDLIHGIPAEEFSLSIGRILNPEDDTGLAGDSYVVDFNSDAAYFLLEADIAERLKINAGVRRERAVLDAEQYAYTPEPMTNLLDEERNSPSLSLTYLFTDAWQLRAAYSETISWPEIFEMLPRRFYDIETLERYEGNPELQPADIENLDLRLEWYPSETESVTLAVFRKDLTNAIENRFDGGFEQFDFYTFDNTESAEVTGVELDVRKEFTFGRDLGHEMFVQFNYTDITSSVDVDFEYDADRPLQGQPDYIANLQLGYDHIESGQEVTLVFNTKGEELAVVVPKGGGNLTNVYSRPYDDVRLIYKKKFLNGLSLSASVDNLLDEERVLEYEDYNLPYLSYSSGRSFKLKADYSF